MLCGAGNAYLLGMLRLQCVASATCSCQAKWLADWLCLNLYSLLQPAVFPDGMMEGRSSVLVSFDNDPLQASFPRLQTFLRTC